ncbi:hypothetical protein EYR40_008041 [Pleurotus pulmonarius]|nr:hypothetical protein EYR40_008041 [Pleurotus pulmonarius]
MMRIHELIDRAQERILNSSRPQNIITSGYKLRSSDSQRGKTDRIGVVNFFVNTMVTALQTPEWQLLLERTGVDATLHLLTDTFIFAPLPNNCMCQLTGQPLMHLIPRYRELGCPQTKPDPVVRPPKRKGEEGEERQSKRRKLQRSGSSTSGPKVLVEEASPADISFFRTRIYYGRPLYAPQTRMLVVGLPPKHILNRINPSYFRKPKASPETWLDPDPRAQAKDARHLSKLQYERYTIPDYTDREQEIQSQGTCKTPKRLKESLKILQRMLWKHGKCGYKPLRDKLCPSKARPPGKEDFDSNTILEMMSEDSSMLFSQLAQLDTSMDTTGYEVSLGGIDQSKAKPKFVEFACGYVEVYRYVAAITHCVIPKAFWGSEANYRLIMRHVKHFITCRRYETLSLHYVLQGFSTAACEWLMPPGEKAKNQRRVSVSDSLKRRELLEEFLFWYFDGFILPLLKTTFYITESSAFRNKTLYFRQDDWETLCAPLLEKLTLTTFKQIPDEDAEELLRQRKLGFAFVRLLPKDTGVRPIVNLRRKVQNQVGTFSGPEKSINQILQAAFYILSYEKQNKPSLLGASVFSPDEIHRKLKNFKANLPKDARGKLPKLYFVKLDVQACFDSITQAKLLDILRSLISEETYLLQRYGKVSSFTGKIERRYMKRAVPDDDQPHFLRYATELAGCLRGTIFADQVVYPHVKQNDILQLLEEHITENIVKIGNHYYQQTVGIPQGSILSTLLCSFFYGDMEKRFPAAVGEGGDSIMLRMVDDYLFVTTSLTKARKFLTMMLEGHPEYGCFISKEKTLINFDHGQMVMNVVAPSDQRFPWCGLTINMTDLSVAVDYSRFHGTSIQNTLTVDHGRNPGKTFVNKILRLAKSRSQAILYDPELNSEHVVLLNVYQHFLMLAMRTHAYVRSWGIKTKRDSLYLYRSICRVVRYTSNSLCASNPAHAALRRTDLIWLGTHAFMSILSLKSLHNRHTLGMLLRDLASLRYRHNNKRFRKLVTEGLSSLTPIHF